LGFLKKNTGFLNPAGCGLYNNQPIHDCIDYITTEYDLHRHCPIIMSHNFLCIRYKSNCLFKVFHRVGVPGRMTCS